MEPMHKNVKMAILDANPQAAPEDIEEYQRLLAERFTVDPDAAPAAAPEFAAATSRETRLSELHRKLFPGHQAYSGRGQQ